MCLYRQSKRERALCTELAHGDISWSREREERWGEMRKESELVLRAEERERGKQRKLSAEHMRANNSMSNGCFIVKRRQGTAKEAAIKETAHFAHFYSCLSISAFNKVSTPVTVAHIRFIFHHTHTHTHTLFSVGETFSRPNWWQSITLVCTWWAGQLPSNCAVHRRSWNDKRRRAERERKKKEGGREAASDRDTKSNTKNTVRMYYR